ncbi:hypothetical protein PTKIN_Ptkin17bG0102600 [Pterospermum kingtungense]
MDLLSLEDFKNVKSNSHWTSFDYLLEVTKVGQEKLLKRSFETRNGEERKRHESYLQYFLYNVAPEPQAMCKEENVGLIKNLNKRKRILREEDEEWEGLKYLKKIKKERPAAVVPVPVTDLPESFKQLIENMGGSGLVLVIQKQIYFSDMSRIASRLSMPFSQLKTHEFLTKAEAERLKNVKNFIKACLLEPSMKESGITFKRWNYGKSSSYVLNKGWNSVVESNGLKVGDTVQVWSFRVNSELCFALVKVQVPTKSQQ